MTLKRCLSGKVRKLSAESRSAKMQLTHGFSLHKLTVFIEGRSQNDPTVLVVPSITIKWETSLIFAHPSGTSARASSPRNAELEGHSIQDLPVSVSEGQKHDNRFVMNKLTVAPRSQIHPSLEVCNQYFRTSVGHLESGAVGRWRGILGLKGDE